MLLREFSIDPDICRASTLLGAVYHHPEYYALQKDRVFARSWQFVPSAERVKAPGHVLPFTLLEDCLDEPLVLAVGDDTVVRCLSNVCTHRGTLVVEGEGHTRTLRCRYHGRRFGLDGCFVSMPEFNDVANFPTLADNLPRIALEHWGPLFFCSLDPAMGFDEWIGAVRDRVGFLPLDQFVFDPSTSRD